MELLIRLPLSLLPIGRLAAVLGVSAEYAYGPKLAQHIRYLMLSDQGLIAFFPDGNCSKMIPDENPITEIDSNPAILPGK